jgi:glycosyltransferase involved in cell wall biosynthesis
VKIGIDASYSIDRQPTGVGIYSRRLIEALAAQTPANEFTLCYRANRYLRSWRGPLPTNCRRALLESIALPGLTRRLDLFHGLNQRLPELRFRRAVSTFHDLFVISNEYSTADYRARFTQLAKHAAERSDRIAAVSMFTADQAAELLGFPRERIAVVPHGVDPLPEFSAGQLNAFRQERGLQRPFLLNVGALQERKNIVRLVEAFERLPGDLLLVLAGSSGYGGERIAERIAASPVRGRIVQLGYVDDAVKAKLYRTAQALAFPSLDEGFGIPILEAMSAGLPVLTSDCSAMPEVAADAAVLVDPRDSEAIADGLRRIVEDENLRQDLRRRGLARAAGFTWLRAAEKMLALYRELA